MVDAIIQVDTAEWRPDMRELLESRTFMPHWPVLEQRWRTTQATPRTKDVSLAHKKPLRYRWPNETTGTSSWNNKQTNKANKHKARVVLAMSPRQIANQCGRRFGGRSNHLRAILRALMRSEGLKVSIERELY